jgi:ATP-dependent RNA helicase DDX24/MAK5
MKQKSQVDCFETEMCYRFQIAVVVGGMAPQKQERLLSYGPEIVVATPGRLWELIQDGNPHLSQVSSIR